MLVSILHRATGDGMATVGTVLFVWWLAALAGGADSYGRFLSWFTGPWAPLGYLVGIGLTLSLFQHICGGVRHLVMDTGAAFELKRNKAFALGTMIAAVVLTVFYWLYLGIK
jgi:succinate dehydrogenase / fumarate reductase cytochrome b subunit